MTSSATTPGLIESPAATSIGFKDWAVVCAALGQGRQSLILRKGGIAEGRQGFRFKHEEFYLFPTQYHQQMEKVRPAELGGLQVPTPPPADSVEIRYFFRMEWALWLDQWDTLARLEPFHIYREEVARERFVYDDQPGLQCAFGRVYRLEHAWTFPDKPGYGGCRSWIQLPPAALDLQLEPVIEDDVHHRVSHDLREALGAFASQLPPEGNR